MAEIVGKIKILEDKIITTKDGVVESWTRWGIGDENKFIVYGGNRYKLIKFKEKEVVKQEQDENLDIDF